MKKGSYAIFFICSNHDPRMPMLQKYSGEEKKLRDEKCQNIINFVRRRDMDTQFVRTYEKRKNEVWKFTSQASTANGNLSPSLHNLSMVDEEEDML